MEFLKTCFMLAMSPVLALYRGWAFWIMWGWFAPLAWGPMPWLNAVGVCLLTGFLTANLSQDKHRKRSEVLAISVTFPLVVLLCGLILHWCGVHGV